MSAHTPGPWAVSPPRADDHPCRPRISADNGILTIAVVLDSLDGYEANAALIAAAPELLESLKATVAWLQGLGFDDLKAIAAIKKAEGK